MNKYEQATIQKHCLEYKRYKDSNKLDKFNKIWTKKSGKII